VNNSDEVVCLAKTEAGVMGSLGLLQDLERVELLASGRLGKKVRSGAPVVVTSPMAFSLPLVELHQDSSNGE